MAEVTDAHSGLTKIYNRQNLKVFKQLEQLNLLRIWFLIGQVSMHFNGMIMTSSSGDYPHIFRPIALIPSPGPLVPIYIRICGISFQII